MAENNSKKSLKTGKVLKIVLSVLVVLLFVFAALMINTAKKDYASATKNAISMGTVLTVKTYGENTALNNETIISCVEQLDDLISWRESGSVIAQLNKNAKVNSADIADVINTCNKISKDSGGVFDITTGNLSKLWGFSENKENVPSDAEIKKALKNVDCKKVKINGSLITCEKGQFIDLGAVGKGYACDMIKAYLEQTDIKGAVVSVGGSIVAYGKRNRAGDKWRIAIRHPRERQSMIGTVKIKDGFVSTSGDYEKYFEKGSKRYHHILNAKTGYPSDNPLVSVTIVCDNGLLSDALSTACFLLGKEEGSALAEKYGVGAVFVDNEFNITTVGDVDFERAG